MNQSTGCHEGGVHERDPITGRVQDPVAHAREVRSMFARISGVYDRMNHLLSLNLDHGWRRQLAACLDPGTARVLDLCAGTGDLGLACLAAGRAGAVVAVDFVPQMLAAIGGKPGSEAVQVVAGDGLGLPLPDACVDAVVIGFGLRNLADPVAGVREMLRVLRPGGQVLILEFFRADPSLRGPARGPALPVRWILGTLVPLCGRLASGHCSAYAYLPASMERFFSAHACGDLLRQEGCREVWVQRLTLGIVHLVGGRLPERS